MIGHLGWFGNTEF